jgi:hypothetical protein
VVEESLQTRRRILARPTADHAVDHAALVPVCQQSPQQMPPDEPGGTGQQGVHDNFLRKTAE